MTSVLQPESAAVSESQLQCGVAGLFYVILLVELFLDGVCLVGWRRVMMRSCYWKAAWV